MTFLLFIAVIFFLASTLAATWFSASLRMFFVYPKIKQVRPSRLGPFFRLNWDGDIEAYRDTHPDGRFDRTVALMRTADRIGNVCLAFTAILTPLFLWMAS